MRGAGEERGRGGAQRATGDVRALLALVIGLGVLILAGTGVVVVTLLHRALAPNPTRGAGGSAPAPVAVDGDALGETRLHEPAGTRIGSVSVGADGVVALVLQGGGEPDRVVLLAGHQDGRVLARVVLVPVVPAPTPR